LLAFRVRRYAALATKPVHRLQIRPIVHSQSATPTIPPSYIRVRAQCGEGQTDTQTAVTNIHFASATPPVKCNKCELRVCATLIGRPFVKRFALCYRTVVLSVCPVCNIGVLSPNGWIDQEENWRAGRPWPWPHCVRRGPSSPPPQSSTSPSFRSMSTVAKRSPISATAEHLFY